MAEDTEESVETKYEELVGFMAGHLLGTDDFEVKSKTRGRQITLQLITPDELRGRVIGRGGRIARAMRTVLEAAGFDDSLSTALDIVD